MRADRRGFTMIEVMITIAILATLTLLTAQTLSESIKSKIKLQDQIDDVSRMRDAIRLIERDINLAYHYRDVEKEINELIKKKNKPPPGGGGNGAPAQTFVPADQVPRRDPTTHFVGNEESINFVTMNNARTVRNSPQADFIEIGYSVRDCRSMKESGGTSKCIWRRSSPYVDLDVTKGGDEIVLLENVSEFKFRYMGKGKQDWVSDWRTDAQGDGVTKGRFPQAVELSLTVEKTIKGKNKKYSMQLIIPIHFPNNPPEGQSGQQRQSSQNF